MFAFSLPSTPSCGTQHNKEEDHQTQAGSTPSPTRSTLGLPLLALKRFDRNQQIIPNIPFRFKIVSAICSMMDLGRYTLWF